MSLLQSINEKYINKIKLTELVNISVPEKELQPVMSEHTIQIHYHTLSKNYTKKAGNNDPFIDGGAYLHNLLWSQLKSPTKNNKPPTILYNRLESRYDSFMNFKQIIINKGVDTRGSQWIILDSNLQLQTINNHAIVENAIMVLDMWEHAYLYDYDADKKKYITNFLDIIDWNIVTDRYLNIRG